MFGCIALEITNNFSQSMRGSLVVSFRLQGPSPLEPFPHQITQKSHSIAMNSSSLKPFHHRIQTHLLSKPLPAKTPLKPFRLRCSSSLLKPAAVTLTAAAALLLSRFPNPSLSLASPLPTQSQSLTDVEDLDDPRSLRALLDLKIKSNDIYDAISILDRLDELEPDDPEFPLLKSHLLIQSGDTDSARHFLEQVIDKNPFSVEAYNGLVMACREAEESMEGVLERIESAIKMCKKAKRREDLRNFKLLKAQIKVAEGEYEEAIRVYEELVKEEPRDFRPYLCEGIVYMLMMKKEEAEKRFEKYRRLVPKRHPYSGFFDDNVIAMLKI